MTALGATPGGGARARLRGGRADRVRRPPDAQRHRRSRGQWIGSRREPEPRSSQPRSPRRRSSTSSTTSTWTTRRGGHRDGLEERHAGDGEGRPSELEERGIRHEMRVMSAHRDPDTVADYAKNARMRGLRVIIAGAGPRRRAARRGRGAHRPAGDRRAAHLARPRWPAGSTRCSRSPRCRPGVPVATRRRGQREERRRARGADPER